MVSATALLWLQRHIDDKTSIKLRYDNNIDDGNNVDVNNIAHDVITIATMLYWSYNDNKIEIWQKSRRRYSGKNNLLTSIGLQWRNYYDTNTAATTPYWRYDEIKIKVWQ